MNREMFVNGRVLLRDRGGVRRFAQEVSDALSSATVLHPRSASHPWSGRLWEQTTLAHRCRNGVLLSMAHSGPLRHRRQIVVVHDLFAITDPSSVNPAYARLLRWQLPRLIDRAAKVVAVSGHVANQVATYSSRSVADIEVVPPGVSAVFQASDQTAARTRLGLDTERPVVCALLDPTPRKNSDQVVALLRHVAAEEPTVQIVVAGRSSPAAFARRATLSPSARRGIAVSRSGLTQNGAAVDLGAAVDVDLAAMYQASDVFVSLSSDEGFGLPPVEAARCGAAVVTTTVPSVRECAPECAIVVETVDDAHAEVLRLVRSPERRAELVRRGKEGLSDLQWSKTAARLEAMMIELAGR